MILLFDKINELKKIAVINKMAKAQKTTELEQTLNGLLGYIYTRDAIFFEAISEKYGLNIEEVKEVAYSVEDNSQKKGKTFKLQARQPKRKSKDDNKQRKKSGYHIYCAEIRPSVKDLLANDADERKFNDKDGTEYVIELNEKGEASFIDINKKCTTMWWRLSEKERSTYKNKADLIHLLVTNHKWKYETAEDYVKDFDAKRIVDEIKSVADSAPEMPKGNVEVEEVEEEVVQSKKKMELPPKKGTAQKKKNVEVSEENGANKKNPKKMTTSGSTKTVSDPIPPKTGKGGARIK